MKDLRAYFSGPLQQEAIHLDRDESRHLLKSCRGRPGDNVVLFDGSGNEIEGNLADDPGDAVIHTKSATFRSFPAPRLSLAIGLPKAKTMDLILRECAEIGVDDIFPLLSGNSEVQLNTSDFPSKISKWTVQLLEGCKQSGNPWLPKLHPPSPVKDCLPKLRGDQIPWLASLQRSWNGHTLQAPVWPDERPHPVLFVGPEGDFTSDEYALLHNAGAVSYSLGPWVMRCPTAVASGLAMIRVWTGH